MRSPARESRAFLICIPATNLLNLRYQSLSSMSIQEVILFFCTKRGIPPEELNRKGRNPKRWCTQYMIWHYLHYSMGMSLLGIARKVDRSRESVCRGIRVLKGHMKYHKAVKAEYLSYVKELEGMAEATPSENMEE